MRYRLRRIVTLCKKESVQIVRDPSALLIAVVFPVVLLFLFAYGINFDAGAVRLGIVLEDDSPAARRFSETFSSSPYFDVTLGYDVDSMADLLRSERVRGFLVVRGDFGRRLEAPGESPSVQLITDGSEPNTASFVAGYVRGAYAIWRREHALESGRPLIAGLTIEERYWFNPSTVSRNFLLPGSITIIMTVIGALLTSMVVAREWERGTMEALLAAGVTRLELITFKLVPYFVLGMLSFTLCMVLTINVFEVPFRGSLLLLYFVASTFLLSALGLGLLISTATKNQFNAAQAALNAAFLPAMMLSGFVFEIASMPAPVRLFTRIIPARYFVTAMQTLFQAGDVWSVIGPALWGLTGAAVFFLGFTFLITRRRLE
ncbi:MAG: ABC transporter permease [Myxococcota bacterium]